MTLGSTDPLYPDQLVVSGIDSVKKIVRLVVRGPMVTYKLKEWDGRPFPSEFLQTGCPKSHCAR